MSFVKIKKALTTRKSFLFLHSDNYQANASQTMLHLLPAELINIVMTYLTRADRMSLGRVSRRYDNLYRQTLTLQAQEVLKKMGHHLVGVSLAEMIDHLAYAQITITLSTAQRKSEANDIAHAINNSCNSIRLQKPITIEGLHDVVRRAKRTHHTMTIVQTAALKGSYSIWPEIIPLRFYLDDICRILILDIFGNLYHIGRALESQTQEESSPDRILLLTQVKEITAHPKDFLILTFNHKLYRLYLGNLKEVECAKPYVHITMGGALTADGQFYRVIRGFGQRPSLDSNSKFIVQACAYFDFLEHDWCKGYLIQHRKFYLDDQGILYEFKVRTNNGPRGLNTEENIVARNVQKFAVNSSYYHLLLVVLQHDGTVFIDRYIYADDLVSFAERQTLFCKGIDLIDDGRYVHIVTPDQLITVTYIDDKIELRPEMKSICPPLDGFYQTYRCKHFATK